MHKCKTLRQAAKLINLLAGALLLGKRDPLLMDLPYVIDVGQSPRRRSQLGKQNPSIQDGNHFNI
jgi:hypothetical protein